MPSMTKWHVQNELFDSSMAGGGVELKIEGLCVVGTFQGGKACL